jgi:hypothetical protein
LWWIILAAVLGGVCCLLMIIIIVIAIRRQQKQRRDAEAEAEKQTELPVVMPNKRSSFTSSVLPPVSGLKDPKT